MEVDKLNIFDMKKASEGMIEGWQRNIDAFEQYYLENPEESPIIIEDVTTDMLSCGTTVKRYRLRE